MATGKNTVVVYKDWLKIFNALEDAEAGRLAKHFFMYINDQNPAPVDRLTELVFIPIETTLKRDLKGWEETKQARSLAGSNGGKKSAELRASKTKQNQAKVPFASKIQAKQAVTDTDSVTDTVNNTNTCPHIDLFLSHCKSILKDSYLPLEFSLKAKYESWKDAGWKDGHGVKIKNWKTKIKNTIPFLKPMAVTAEQNPTLKNW